MAIDPLAVGSPSPAHVSLHEAALIARSRVYGTTPRFAAATNAAQNHELVTTAPIRSAGTADPDRWDEMLNRLGAKYNVPPLFLKAVMLAESGGDPNAIGDNGHSVGLFQLHDQGYGYGMGDLRFDPEANADRAARGLAESWHAVLRQGYTGEDLIRAAYDYSFNPGGGWAYQGDSVVRHYRELLAKQGLA